MAKEAAALTQRRLRAAVVTIVGQRGLASVTARSVAAEAGVNQALIFYHFGTLTDLVAAAYRESVDEALGRYREALASAHGLGEVLDAVEAELGTDRADGGAALMAQLLAAAGQDEALAQLARELLGEWRTVVGEAVERAMADSALEGLVSSESVVEATLSGMLGAVLVDGAEPGALSGSFATLRELDRTLARFSRLPSPVRRAVRSVVAPKFASGAPNHPSR
ncbi:TetR/AcrR family transcriptional regulator [Dermacoccus abyssi]|uniref:TetR/AcrR family transcriptional regulator n=1 Tax=Dermacoccus abyssi TaxID=322596 RepID=A0ABX5ZBF3_9MICO|nr:TetR/AcrR family transcriptional regulator [Dermacoccus abyssi]